MKKTTIAGLAAFLAASLALAGCSGGAAVSGGSAGEEEECSQPGTTGVTDDTIKFGTSVPLSGALSVYGGVAVAQQAYFDMVNAEGGVKTGDGKTRKLELIALDDGYDPSRTKTNTDELINREKVFGLSNSFGTSGGLAARPVLKEACAFSVFVGSGNPKLSDPKEPLQIGGTVVTEVEGEVMAGYLRDNMPDAKVAILAQNGDFGVPFLEGFNKTIEGTGVTVVGSETYEPTDTDVRQQVTTLAATGADAFFVVATGNTVLQAINNSHSLGWKPQILVPSGASLGQDSLKKLDQGAGDGALIANLFKDVERDATDPAMALYLSELAKQPNASNYSASTILGGWIAGQLTVEVLKTLDTVDRKSYIEAVHNFKLDEPTVVRDGIPLFTTPDDAYMFHGEGLDLYDAEAGTLTPVEVIDTTKK